MCGIAGIIDFSGKTPREDLLKKMTDTLYHRGPDESGTFIRNGVGLGHTRLSIIDLSNGQQPMVNRSNNMTISYNGEIYNFKVLRKELEAEGIEFKTNCDTEVILYGYQQWGQKIVDKIRGMFAFAIYDEITNKVFLARDRLGIKPLYYAELNNHQLIFASELKALVKHPRLERRLRPESIEEYFSLGYIPEPHSIFEQVKKLSPGYFLDVDLNTSQVYTQCYWDVSFSEDSLSEAEAIEAFNAYFQEAVDIRMVSDVPIGSFLSGGVDSSAVVAKMSQLSQDPVNTCSIGFGAQEFDESDYANQVAKRYQTNHYLNVVDPNDASLVTQLASFYDEPYADSSALPTYRVCELAKQHVTVALSGDGGDEIFAGYRRYKFHMAEEKMRNILPFSIRKPVFGLLGRCYPKLDWAPKVLRGKSTFQSMAKNSVEAYFHTVSILRAQQRRKLFSDEYVHSLNGYDASQVFHMHADKMHQADPLSLIQYLDIKTYLVGDILTKVDRASMATSLEVRVPLLDHKLVEWAANLPRRLKLNGQEGKYLLKKAMEPHLPNDILYRRKMGFAVPLKNWFRKELKTFIRDAVLDERMLDSGYFNKKYLTQLLDQHQKGSFDHSAPLWTLMMFQQFLKNNT